MKNMCYTKFYGEKLLARAEYNTISNKLLIFGGANNENFINFDFTICGLEFFAKKYARKNDILDTKNYRCV